MSALVFETPIFVRKNRCAGCAEEAHPITAIHAVSARVIDASHASETQEPLT